MADNDDVIGAILFAVEMLIRQATWDVQAAGPSAKDKEAAEFVWDCMNDMSDTWTDTISEVLSFLTFGWSAHELVYKRRMGKSRDPRLKSKFDDGLIGWQKLPPRAQDTLWKWLYDENDNLTGLAQMPPPRFDMIEIPMDRLLLFRTKSRKGGPEGRSILRNAYRDWYFKRRIQEFEGIGIERDLAGFPTITVPENTDLWADDDPDMVTQRAAAEEIVRSIRRDSREGVVLPFGWELKLLSSGGQRQFDTSKIIDRYDTRIAMTVLADFVLLGHQQEGSFALSSDKTKLFSMAIGSYLDIISETFNNKAIPALIDLNAGRFSGITDYPRLVHGDVESPDLTSLSAYIKDMTGVGVIVPDDALEDHIRDVAHLPERMPDAQPRQQPANAPKGPETPDDEITLEDDGDAVGKALARLGRM